MPLKTEKNGQIVKQNPDTAIAQRDQMFNQIALWKGEIQRALPRHVTPERMMAVIRTAFSRNERLLECTPLSVIGSIMTASQLGLEPNTPLGHCSLIPFRNNKRQTMECQLIIEYQGMMDLARRSGEIAGIWADVVRQGDQFSYCKGLEPSMKHIPSDEADREQRPITHVYAVASLKSGEKIFVVLTRSEVEKYRKRSKSPNDGPWATDHEAMCKKTAIRRLYTWLPKSIEMARAAALDEAPEIGRPQAEIYDEQLLEKLRLEGLEVDEATGEIKEPPSDDNPPPGSEEVPVGEKAEASDGLGF